MNITVNKDGAVSFTQMSPTTARLLLDLATDLAAGRIALHYEDDAVVAPTAKARKALDTVRATYEKHNTPPVGGETPWDTMWHPVDMTRRSSRSSSWEG